MSNSYPISRLVPFNNENRWSDLLAALIEIDPDPLSGLLGLPAGSNPTVTREVHASKGAGDRPDLEVRWADVSAVLEVKVLSDLGREQLARYATSFPTADRYAVIHPALFPVRATGQWLSVPWEDVLSAFADSTDPWVSSTAWMWGTYLSDTMPKITAETAWRDVPAGQDLFLAVRARMRWLLDEVRTTSVVGSSVTWELGAEASGRAPLLIFSTPTGHKDDYTLTVQVSDRVGSRGWPKGDAMTALEATPGEGLKGPRLRMALAHNNTDTSSDFDWEFLSDRVWPMIKDTSGLEWQTRPGLHHKDDKDNFATRCGIKQVGYGFGMKQAQSHSRSCEFGGSGFTGQDINMGELAALVAKLVAAMTDIGNQAWAAGS